MSDPSERIPNPTIAEAVAEGELIFRVEQKRTLTEPEAAALVYTLRHLADMVDESCLDRPAAEVLEDDDVSFNVDEPDIGEDL